MNGLDVLNPHAYSEDPRFPQLQIPRTDPYLRTSSRSAQKGQVEAERLINSNNPYDLY